MNRVFQTSVNAATQELTDQMLKGMTEHPKNNELIDGYRQMKRKLAEAEARQAVEEFVKEVVATTGYKKWLAGELKKDERRKKKRVPDDDLKRVQSYIVQMKQSLPAVIPTVTHFAESTDRWGRKGLWRVQAYGYLSGLAVVDGDHVPNPEQRIEEWLKREDFNDLGIVWIFITPSGEGVKVVFKAREEWGNLQDNAYTMAEKLGILEYADGQTKNSDHAHFIPKASDVKYIDWKELFTYENPAYEQKYGEAYRRGELEPTQPRWQELERQRKGTQKPAGDATVSENIGTTTPATLTEREHAIVKALNEHYGETVAEGRRHETFLSETAPWLLLLTDNNAQKTLAMSRQLTYVGNWTDQTPDELENCISTVQKKPLLRRRPKVLAELLEKAGIKDEQQTANMPKNADPMGDLPFDRWCDKIEGFFDVYPCLREVCEPHPRRLWPFLLFASAAMMGTCMTLCYYKFYANKASRTRLTYIILSVGDPTSGKGTLTRLMELLLAPILESDAIADQATNQWKEKFDATASNKEHDTRQKIYNRFFGPRASNGEFIRSMINNKAVVDHEEMPIGCVTVDCEKDNSINMSRSGGWQNRDIMVLKSFHTEYDSQHYQNRQSVSGRFRVVWQQIETCTPPTLRRLVNERNVNSGLDTRMATIPMGKPDYDMMPLEGNEDKLVDFNETLKQWSYRLDQRRGELPIWPLVEHVHKWCDERRAIAEFNDDQADWLQIKRVPYYGLAVSAPWVDMRHWQEREETGTYVIDDTDRELCDLVLDIQYRTQHHWFYDLHRKYYDDQLRDAAQYVPHRSRFSDCYRELPETFSTEQFAQVFGYANPRSGQKALQRLQKEKAIKRTMRGCYKKLVSEI